MSTRATRANARNLLNEVGNAKSANKHATDVDKDESGEANVPKTGGSKHGSNDAGSQKGETTKGNAKTTGTKPKVAFGKNGCGLCNEMDDNEMVQCDTCDDWFHFMCVGVTGGIAEKDWVCEKCEILKDTGSKQATGRNSEKRLGGSCIRSSASRKSQRRREVELQKLEDERRMKEKFALQRLQMQEQIEKEILDKKYDILLEEADELSEESDTVGGTGMSEAKIEEWITTLDKYSREDYMLPRTQKVDKQRYQQRADLTAVNLRALDAVINKQQISENFQRTENPSNDDLQVLFRRLLEKEETVREAFSSRNDLPLEINPRISIPPRQNVSHLENEPFLRNSPRRRQESFGVLSLRSCDDLEVPPRTEESPPGNVPRMGKAPPVSGVHAREDLFSGRRMPNHNQPYNSHHRERHAEEFVPIMRSTTYGQQNHPVVESDSYMLNRSQLAARQVVPKELPEFCGNPEDWPLFFSTFTSSTEMCGYSDEENILRLRKCLSGRALEAVRSRLLHPANVKGVIATLKMLYGKPETIIHSFTMKIRGLPPPDMNRLETLVNFALSVDNLCATIGACEVEEFLYNASLRYELVEKLPPSLKMEWARHTRGLRLPTLSNFSTWLYSMAEDASSVLITDFNQRRPRSGVKENRFINVHSDAPAQHLAISRTGSDSKECVVCKGNCQAVNKCDRFIELSYDSKWAVVKEFRLCKKCKRRHYGICRMQKECGKNGCPYKHHFLLHNPESITTISSATQNRPSETITSELEQNCNIHQTISSEVLFRIVPITLYGPDTEIKTFAFLDDGSELTLIEEELAEDLKLEGPVNPLCLKWTGETRRYENNSRKVNLKVSGHADLAAVHQLAGVRTVAALNLPQQTLNVEEMRKRFPYLKGIPMLSYRNAVPRILIGLDHIRLGHTLKSREGGPNEPVAIKTRLGWTLYGSSNRKQPTSRFVNHHSANVHHCDCDYERDELLHKSMKDYFLLDSMGVVRPSQSMLSKEEQRALEMLQQMTRFTEGRYETGLLWKYGNIRLPDSRIMALKRWKCLEKRMDKDEKLAAILNAKIQEYINKGYVRKLSPEELSVNHSRIWYLPIFPVVNPNKPEKIRIVWDVAAKVHGVSLNSVLLKGPDQLASLVAVLHLFREYRYGVSGDIREMFHQILMKQMDQDSLRFFFKDDQTKVEPSVFVMLVMTFGACCSPSSAQFVKNLNAAKYIKQYPAAVDVIIRKHYVDDMLMSVETEQEAIKLAKEVKYIHHQGGFEIRNWISNSPRILDALGEESKGAKNLELGSEMSTSKVLGLFWCTTTDTFTFKLSSRHDPELLSGVRQPTKREVLRMLMLVYDPLGLIAHVLMYIKVLLQDIWRSGIGWDDVIGVALFKNWQCWLRVLPSVENIQIPRCFRTRTSANNSNEVQMHVFVDGSDNGFAAAVFLRFQETETIECSLIGAKTRVAPLRYLSTPRMELQAGILGVRLAASIAEILTMKISKHYYWTDSRNLLCWLSSDHRRYNPFVACRISEILEATDVSEWRYVPTSENVADDGTKWKSQPDVSPSSRWFNGPEFLYRSERFWPSMSGFVGPINEELRPHLLHHFEGVEQLVDVDRFSSWVRIYRVTAFVLRAVVLFKRGTKTVSKRRIADTTVVEPLKQQELVRAQNYLYRQAQMSSYADELTILQTNNRNKQQRLIPKSSPLYRLSPYLDENGVIRSHYRTGALPYAELRPENSIILPSSQKVTQLVLQYYHCNLLHRNHETAINKLRLRYHVPRLRQVYRKIRGNCQRCKIAAAVPRPPAMGDLPLARLAVFNRPFSYVGVDYFGPMLVQVGRRCEKRWGVLVTCMTTRAIHIEVAHSLSADSCIMALRCFMGRRGVPHVIYSDNGTNLVGASKELVTAIDAMDQNKLITEIISPHTEWKLIPPASPHMGGAWERLIQTVKKNLCEKRLPRTPSDEVLRNALVEIEHTVNSRPLTYVPLSDENAAVLTPNHFLIGSADGLKPLALFDDSAVAVKMSWQMSQTLANVFWRHWLTDYLPNITRRTKWFNKVEPIKVGDIVVIVDPKSPRNSWPKGKVIAAQHSKDGQVRRATVQTATGIYERPAVKLAVLDIGVGVSTSQEHLSPTLGGSVKCATMSNTPFSLEC